MSQDDNQGGGSGPPTNWELAQRVSLLEREAETMRERHQREVQSLRDDHIEPVKDSVKGIQSNLSKVVWMVITAVIAAAMAMIIGGGSPL